MPLQFPVARRTILLCDYSLGGFHPPEMVKRRPAVIISPRLPYRDGLCAVVPLSGSEPERAVPYTVRFVLQEPLPHPFPQMVWWAKCDMVATVAFGRLDLFRTARVNGRRQYAHPKLSDEQFGALLKGVLHGLGIGHLTSERPGPFW
jgi:mRNA interferase MazF